VEDILATFLTVLLLLTVSAMGEIQTITSIIKQPIVILEKLRMVAI
jgi:hypothetical protein